MTTRIMGEDNLALQPGVVVTVSVTYPTGGGAVDPAVLLNEIVCDLDGQPLVAFAQSNTFDTYDGQNQSSSFDWYELAFPAIVHCNCLEMTMGLPYRDGGWWTSLAVEFYDKEKQAWTQVENFTISPPYNFANEYRKRVPYETYALSFQEVNACRIRIIGQPGGLAAFTSLARLAVYQRDLSRWNPASLPDPPIPRLFRLIPPQVIWDMVHSLVKLTRLIINLPLLEYYLDDRRHEEFWQTVSRNYTGEPELWFLVADSLGWSNWVRSNTILIEDQPISSLKPYTRLRFFNTLASAVAPIVVGNQLLGVMITEPVIVKDMFDLEWHQRYAREQKIPWPIYQASLERTPRLTMEQFEGTADLMGIIVNSLANLAYRNTQLERELDSVQQKNHNASQGKELIRRSIAFMQENLENPITVARVAHEVALSPSYFCVLFREQMGQNPRDFLIELRLERAKEYLAYTSLSVMEICGALGYDPSYFSRLFKRHTGSTPGQYAQHMRTH